VLDFTSALYLGLHHPSSSLSPWRRLTSGVPAALREPRLATKVAAGLAQLVGAERALVQTSTLHLFWDLFVALGGPRSAIHVDAHAYPIARWGAERAAAQGTPVSTFGAHDPAALERRVRASGRRPLVLADGYCPGCGPTPLREYAAVARAFGGALVVDDTQPPGVLGPGGGGSLRGLGTDRVVVGASLAKGLGVPIAVLAGDPALVARYEARSETRVHCSPPSTATLHAAEHALAVNARSGDELRRRLAAIVDRFRAQAGAAGYAPAGGAFPVQTVAVGRDALLLHARLRARGVAAALVDGEGRPPRLTFLLTVRHTPADVAHVFAATAPAYARPA
jgi:8-amino-7-oxononanoate synthase